ncbi:MAG: hypothetical protein CVT62_11405 [Actinobacteria bacterium HGW-Actinobacteria-2]|nr:MAG: hypothetical protein CVT62_11405 [Actinobacteria bacterium HGW-Actinobacteria-2]
MTINEHDIERFLSGDLPDDHPAWTQTAAFSQRLNSVFPSADGPLDAAQLAAVVNEARQVRTRSALQRNLVPPPMKPSRLVLAVAAAAVLAVSSGAGLAAALTGGLNQQATNLKMQLPVAPVSQAAPAVSQPPVAPTPAATESEPSEEAAPLETEKPKVVHKKTVTHKAKAKPKPTKTATKSHDEDEHEDSDEGDHEDEHEDDD